MRPGKATRGCAAARRCGRIRRSIPTLGMVYVAAGNAWPDIDGTARGGDNLFTASIVALDLKTGVYKWHFQEVHHDIWDYDNLMSAGARRHPLSGPAAEGPHSRRQDRIYSTSSIAPTASRSSASRNGPCRRSHASRPRRRSRSDWRFVRADVSRTRERRRPGMKSSCIFGAYCRSSRS